VNFDASELRMAKYIVTGLTIVLLGFSACGIAGFESDVRVAKVKAAAPGYTGCDNHCGTTALQIESK
jgi:hypothetical protein